MCRHLHHLPKVSIWSRKGLTSTVASVKGLGHCKQADSAILKVLLVQASRTNIFHHKTNLCGDYALLLRHGLCRIYAHFVANMRCFGFVLCRLLRRHLGFDSDFAQMSSPRNGGWNLWCNGYKLVFLLNLNLISKRFKLVFHWNSTGFQIYFHCYLNKVSTGFLMDFYLYSIEILTGFPIGFHWNLIEIYN